MFELPNQNFAKRITLLDSKSGEIIPVRPNQPVLSSAKFFWDNLRFEHHLVSPADIPAVRFHDFGICLELGNAATANELQGKNKRSDTLYEICFVPPLTEIKSQFVDAHLEMLYLHFDPIFIRRIADETAESDLREMIPKLTGFDITIQHLSFVIQQELSTGCPNGNLFIESLETALAVYLLKNYSATRLDTFVKGGLTPRDLRRVVEYINDNLEEDLRLSEVAAIAGKSQYYFARLFKQSIGLSVHRYVQEQRVKLAKTLLASQSLGIIEISHRVGFNSHSRFSALFRRLTGFTPADYRKNL